MIVKCNKKIFLRSMEFYEISLEELKNKQENGAIIIDVRSEQEYKEGHLNYAINLPEYMINKNIMSVLKDKNKELIVYCQKGIRSRDARKRFIKLGYKYVYSLYGGLENYI